MKSWQLCAIEQLKSEEGNIENVLKIAEWQQKHVQKYLQS